MPVLHILGQNPLMGKADEEGRILEVAGRGSNGGLFDGSEDDFFCVHDLKQRCLSLALSSCIAWLAQL